LPELVIAKKSKLKSCCTGQFGLNKKADREESISAMFGNFGSSGNGRRVEIASGGVKIFEHRLECLCHKTEEDKDSQARAPAVHKKLREHRQEYLHPTAQKRCGGGPGPVPQKTVKILVEQRAYGTEKSTDIR